MPGTREQALHLHLACGRRPTRRAIRSAIIATQSDLAIIGAGPAGLSAAREAIIAGLTPTVLERLPRVGGIARTEEHHGYRFDLGGHRFLTHMPEIQRIWEETLGDDLLTVARQSRIRYRDRFLLYPLRIVDALRNVGAVEGARMVLSYVKATLSPPGPQDTLEQWVTRRFGRRLYEAFFRNYTEKVWGIPCTEIRAEWASQRIQGLSLRGALLDAIGIRSREKTLSDTFLYPRLGPGMMWDRFAAQVSDAGGTVLTNAAVTQLVREGDRIAALHYRQAGAETAIEPDSVISSMPIDDLIRSLQPAAPEAVLAAASALRYRGFIIVQLAIDRPNLFPYHWIYVQTAQVKAGRIQNFGNWSPDLLPSPNCSSLGVEYFTSVGDDIWSMPDDELLTLAASELQELRLIQGSWVTDGTVVRQSKAYPVYDDAYRRNLDIVRGFLSSITNLQTVGRAGMHRYNNLDHSMLTGILAVRNLLGQEHDVWRVNADHGQPMG